MINLNMTLKIYKLKINSKLKKLSKLKSTILGGGKAK